MSDSEVAQASADNFEQLVVQASNSKPVLVDFWAPWCGPCKTVAPLLEQIAAEYGDKISVVKVNVDDNPEAAGKYGVSAIPTLAIFKNGAVADTRIGAQPKAKIAEFVDSTIG